MNNIAHLIRSANRIGQFFEAFPNRDDGMEGIADHIQKFWEPRMRTALLDFLRENPSGEMDGAALTPLTLEAITRNGQRLTPRVATTV